MEGASGSLFEWRDGPFLKALKNGDWIVLDEVCLGRSLYLYSRVSYFLCCVLLTDELGLPVGAGRLECLLGSQRRGEQIDNMLRLEIK